MFGINEDIAILSSIINKSSFDRLTYPILLMVGVITVVQYSESDLFLFLHFNRSNTKSMQKDYAGWNIWTSITLF